MKNAICVGLLASVLFGCGGKTDEPAASGGSGGGGAVAGTGGAGATGGGGSGGAGATGGGGAGGSGGMGGACAVPVTEPGPYALKIKIVNPTSQSLFVREDCMLNWSLYACTDGYTTALSHAANCTIDCSDDPTGCIACGACMLTAHEVTPAAPVSADFGGYTYTFSQNASGCSCHNQIVAPPGKYAIRVPVFLSQQDAESGTAAYTAEAYFDLPAPNGVVEVNLAQLGEG